MARGYESHVLSELSPIVQRIAMRSATVPDTPGFKYLTDGHTRRICTEGVGSLFIFIHASAGVIGTIEESAVDAAALGALARALAAHQSALSKHLSALDWKLLSTEPSGPATGTAPAVVAAATSGSTSADAESKGEAARAAEAERRAASGEADGGSGAPSFVRAEKTALCAHAVAMCNDSAFTNDSIEQLMHHYGINSHTHDLPEDTVLTFHRVRDIAKRGGRRCAERLVRVLIDCEFAPRIHALNPAMIGFADRVSTPAGRGSGEGGGEGGDGDEILHQTLAGATSAFGAFLRSARRVQSWLHQRLNAHHGHYVAKRLAEELCVRYVATVTRCAAEQQRRFGVLRRFTLSPSACGLIASEITQTIHLCSGWVARTGSALHLPPRSRATHGGRTLDGWERAVAFAHAFGLFVTIPPPFIAPMEEVDSATRSSLQNKDEHSSAEIFLASRFLLAPLFRPHDTVAHCSGDAAKARAQKEPLFSPLSIYVALERAVALRADRELNSVAKRGAVLAAAAFLLANDGDHISSSAIMDASMRIKRAAANALDEQELEASSALTATTEPAGADTVSPRTRAGSLAPPLPHRRGRTKSGAPVMPPRAASVTTVDTTSAAPPVASRGGLGGFLGRLRSRSAATEKASPRSSVTRTTIPPRPRIALRSIADLVHETQQGCMQEEQPAARSIVMKGMEFSLDEKEFDPFVAVFPVCAGSGSTALKLERFSRGEAHVRLGAQHTSGETEERLLRLVSFPYQLP